MGGPKVNFRHGRVDKSEEVEPTPDGRLPDANLGAQHLREIFGRMGLNDREIVALSGAHTLGRCHKERSGFEGPWTEDPLKFDNSYFVDLLKRHWEKKGNQFEDKESHKLMMLPTDISLLGDDVFRPIVE